MVEKNVADAILQSDYRVEIGGATFRVSPPRNSTIIRLSEMVVNLPELETDKPLEEVLLKGRQAKIIGDIIALLVCGEIAPIRLYSLGSIFSHFRRDRRFRKVRRAVMYNATPSETVFLLTTIMRKQQIGDFFSLIISLKNANILKATREMTASGQRSEAQQ